MHAARMGRLDMHTKFSSRQPKERENLQILGLDRRIILIYILGRVDVDWINLAQRMIQWSHLMRAGINFSGSMKCDLS